MGEALIVGRGGGSSGGSGKLKTEIITSNTVWSVPAAKDQLFSVRIFGGGGAGGGTVDASDTSNLLSSSGGGGGGGFMNNSMLNLAQGQSIVINIGCGGKANTTSANYTNQRGGTTFFGSYLSAAGGQAGKSDGAGGDGGSGGGGVYTFKVYTNGANGGNGYQFGGGAGGINAYGGYGGKWGGGGGHGGTNNIKSAIPISSQRYGGCLANPTNPGVYNNVSNPGQYRSGLAGNAGVCSNWYYYNRYGINDTRNDGYFVNTTSGSNTIGNNNIYDGSGDVSNINIYEEDICAGNLRGNGRAHYYVTSSSWSDYSYTFYATGGGGGFGGRAPSTAGGGFGGNGGNDVCGGGGGYGGDGGDGDLSILSDERYCSGGGGGGYGKSGKGGSLNNTKDGGFAAGGCGGASGSSIKDENWMIGFAPAGNGGNGICIIQYYEV